MPQLSRQRRRRPLLKLPPHALDLLTDCVAEIGTVKTSALLGFSRPTLRKLIRGAHVARTTVLAAQVLIAESLPLQTTAEAA